MYCMQGAGIEAIWLRLQFTFTGQGVVVFVWISFGSKVATHFQGVVSVDCQGGSIYFVLKNLFLPRGTLFGRVSLHRGYRCWRTGRGQL